MEQLLEASSSFLFIYLFITYLFISFLYLFHFGEFGLCGSALVNIGSVASALGCMI